MFKKPPTFVDLLFKKAPSPKPPAKIMNPWPDGAPSVKIYLWKQIGDLKPGRYTLSRQPYSQGEEAKYTLYGYKGSWTESSLIELVNSGDIMVLPG